MRVDELDIPDRVADLLVAQGFRELHPPQAEAVPLALEGRSLVVAIPTASGKSLIGMIPALKLLHERGGKVLYIVPLKALASEKRDDFQVFADKMGFRVHMSTGDLDSTDKGMDGADVVIATSEKADSLLRHGSRWLDGVRMIIADEIHTIHDPGRGPTLEVALTKMMRKCPGVQVIALSATISNAYDVADWLKAGLVRSDWRPVPLREGVFLDDAIRFSDGKATVVPSKGDPVESMVLQTVADGGQCLVFVNSRRSTEALASRIAGLLKRDPKIPAAERAVLRGESEATETGERLDSCVSKGAAFHNAGLTYSQRRIVESRFKSGDIKCIVATPTLAAGINLPARRVIVRDTSRYENGGNVPIPVMEIKQMCGRAGRPGYDPYGEAVLLARSEKDSDRLFEDYIEHETERVTSKLFSGNAIRGHILGLFATGDADSEDSVVEFMRSTFYGTTSQMFGVENVVTEVVDFLGSNGMVERVGDRIEILPFGKRVSDLCIDPVTAVMLREAVGRIDDDTGALPILVACAMTPDVMGMYPKKADEARIQAAWDKLEEDGLLLLDPYGTPDYMPELFQSDLKVALLAEMWIDETPEGAITKDMGVGPGDIRSRMDMLDWIVYAMGEIAYIFNPTAIRRVRPLSVRIRYGVKEELTDLVSLRGVGRTRARSLFDAGIRGRSDVASAGVAAISEIPGIGKVLAERMVDQAGGSAHAEAAPTEEESFIDEMAAAYGGEEDGGEDPSGKRKEAGPKQASLFDF